MKRHLLLIFLFLTLFSMGLLILNYTGDAATNRGRAVSKAKLPEELKNATVRDYFIGFPGKDIGFIQTVVGTVIVARGDMSQAYYAAPGDKLFEKDVVFTLKSSRCRFRLNGEDVVTMGENAKVGIKSFIDNRIAKTKSATFNMARGKAMYYSLRLFKYKGSSMNVETPTAVCGVRGTKFGVEVIELEGKPTASLPIIVADVSDTGFRQLAQANQPNYQTNVYCFEGQIQVTSPITGQTTPLGEGQGLNAGGTGLGGSFTTPPGVARGFQAGTEGSTPGGDTGGTGGTGTDTGTGAGTGTTGTTDTSGITQNQNTKDLILDLPPPPTRPTTHVGYATGLVTYNYYPGDIISVDENYLHGIISSSDRQNFAAASVTVGGASDNMTVQNFTSSSPTLTSLYIGGYGGATSKAISKTELGYNAYTEWGSWTQPSAVSIMGTDYYFDNKGYYIWGDVTTDNQMASLKGIGLNATYSGSALGTYWTSSGGADMNGTFSCNVNFVSPSISNFNVDVSGGGHSASIAGASGGFSGNSSQFTINPPIVSTWKLDGNSGASGSASGSVYGKNGEAIGGGWNMYGEGGKAHGIFQGAK